MNTYDSSKIMELLRTKQGLEPAENAEEADLIVLNTCSVREKAQEKVFSDLGRFNELKALNPKLIIAVGGCVASQEGEQILARAPYVDLIFGPQTLHRLPEMLTERLARNTPQIDVTFPEIEKFDHLPPAQQTGPTAFVSIMEGCSKYCSFCIVPQTRGEEFSRPLEGILSEITSLTQKGVRDVTLLGQNVNAWWDPSGAPLQDFTFLIEQVSSIPKIERIRYTSSHPLEFTQRLAEAHGRIPQLAGQIHLPVQSGSNRVLSLMKRGYTNEYYQNIIHQIRKNRLDISISSDFIVGFPGETDEDFQETLQLIDEVAFDGGYAFAYSPRPGTPANLLSDSVPHEIKQNRLKQVLERIERHSRNISISMIGTEQQVLIDGTSKRNNQELRGRTDNNRVVNFKGNPRLIGQMASVLITDTNSFSLNGQLISIENTPIQ